MITCKPGQEPDMTPVIDYTKYDGKKVPQRVERDAVSKHTLSPVICSCDLSRDDESGLKLTQLI